MHNTCGCGAAVPGLQEHHCWDLQRTRNGLTFSFEGTVPRDTKTYFYFVALWEFSLNIGSNFTGEQQHCTQIVEAIKPPAPHTHSPTQAFNKLFVEPSAVPAIPNQGTSMETSRSAVVSCHSLIITSVCEWKNPVGDAFWLYLKLTFRRVLKDVALVLIMKDRLRKT